MNSRGRITGREVFAEFHYHDDCVHSRVVRGELGISPQNLLFALYLELLLAVFGFCENDACLKTISLAGELSS